MGIAAYLSMQTLVELDFHGVAASGPSRPRIEVARLESLDQIFADWRGEENGSEHKQQIKAYALVRGGESGREKPSRTDTLVMKLLMHCRPASLLRTTVSDSEKTEATTAVSGTGQEGRGER